MSITKPSEPVSRHAIPAARQLVHERTVRFKGFSRDNGLWDIEGEIIDTKPTPWPTHGKGVLPPGEPLHHMRVTLTLDDALEVKAVALEMPSTPYAECHGTLAGVRKLVGASIASGWRKGVNDALGGVSGCTHVRELIINMGTAAYQTIGGEELKAKMLAPVTMVKKFEETPRYLGGCIALDLGGAVVARHYPEHAKAK